jgi:hypothetical protein
MMRANGLGADIVKPTLLTLLGLPGMSPQCPLLGETRSEMLGVSLSAKRSHLHGAEGKLDFGQVTS